jgi:hypothetical protein
MKKILEFFKKKQKTRIPSFDLMRLEAEKISYPWKQEMENNKIRREAEREAFDKYCQWDRNQLQNFIWKAQYPDSKFNPYIGVGIFIPNRSCLRLVYPGQKTVSSEEYNKIVSDKFEEFKEKYKESYHLTK